MLPPLDVRSLAIFRILFGLTLLLGDVVPNLPYATTFYGDAGLLPRAVMLEHHSPPWYWSIHYVSGSDVFVLLATSSYAVALAALVVGWHTRIATLVCFVLCVSQQTRNYMLVTAFDLLAAAMLFWSIDLPLGAVCSFDAARRQLANLQRSKESTMQLGLGRKDVAATTSVATVAIRMQIWIMYYCSMASKTDPAWTTDFTALQLVLQTSIYGSKPLAALALRSPSVCKLLTRMTFVVEYVLPPMLLLPTIHWLELPARATAFVGLCGFHAGIAATCGLGPIPFINMVVLLPFLPTSLWERLSRRDTPAYVVIHANERPLLAMTRCFIAELWSELRGGSVLLSKVDRGGTSHSHMASAPGVPSPGAHVPHGMAPGTEIGRRPPDVVQHRSSWSHAVWQLVLCWTLVGIFVWNLNGFGYGLSYSSWSDAQKISVLPIFAFNLHQAFDVFAPRPIAVDFFYSLPARLRNGEHVDLGSIFERYELFDLTRTPSSARPSGPLPFATNRWRRYVDQLREGWPSNDQGPSDRRLRKKVEAQREAFGRWVCRRWEQQHGLMDGQQLDEWDLCFTNLDNTEAMPLDETGSSVPLPVISAGCVWKHFCYDTDAAEMLRSQHNSRDHWETALDDDGGGGGDDEFDIL